MIDLLVAGGGPVGLAAAIRARRSGLEVTLVEPRTDPVDKACGEGLMPGGVAALRDLGVHPQGRDFHGIRYVADGRVAEARFTAGPGLGVRRTSLHGALARAADDAGVNRVVGRVSAVQQETDHVAAAGLRARYLVAADGLHSPVRHSLGLDRRARGAARYGLRRHFGVRPWTDLVEVHWSATAEAYVTPVADEVVGVAVLTGPGRAYDEVLADFPALQARLRDGEPITEVRGAGPMRQTSAARSQGRVLLVGDAAGYLDALTGEGLATGLATAEAAVAAVLADRPADYEQSWRRATRRYRMLTGGLLAVVARPRARRALVPAAARVPWGFRAAVDALACNT